MWYVLVLQWSVFLVCDHFFAKSAPKVFIYRIWHTQYFIKVKFIVLKMSNIFRLKYLLEMFTSKT